jgi:hypothetical protein
MRFTKPINREVDIHGNTFVLTLDDTGVGFRLKGKRKTAQTDWASVLERARGESGETARELFELSFTNRSAVA